MKGRRGILELSVFRLEAVGMKLIPSKRVVEEFLLAYELKGCQKQ
jgi:hypothetical protein